MSILRQNLTYDTGIWHKHKMGGEVETAVQQVTQSQDTLVTALVSLLLSLSLLPSSSLFIRHNNNIPLHTETVHQVIMEPSIFIVAARLCYL